MKKNLSTQYLTRIAVLTALASILFMIEIPIVAFYKLDLSNLPVLLGAFSMGPWAGLAILLLKSVIGMLHSTSMYVGELADFIMGAAMVLPAALIYKANKTRKGASSAWRPRSPSRIRRPAGPSQAKGAGPRWSRREP